MCSVIDMGGGVLAHTSVPCEINSIEMLPQNICIYAYFMASFLPGSSFTIQKVHIQAWGWKNSV